MLRKLIILSVCAGTSASVPILWQSNTEAALAVVKSAFVSEPEVLSLDPEPIVVKPLAAGNQYYGGRSVQLAADDRGHFLGNFKINGRRVEALIDTGATAVAINLSTARRIGIAISPTDMVDTVGTANGKARAALVNIDRLEIGRISVDNVRALVLDDASLSTTLIGMTFLQRLKKFQVDADNLTLVQ